ncbi:ABC transporter substrate-binding protein [Andreprevotia sp. IGB-42]|uniref:substrate-binding periplasmic protein n=1 Tax=Andreprevotia sp. IGB-42 TaxID=2497473 RepID=UPI00135B1656|nr:transporter substrate-binding domain-containing protein [Andreprevotia sp. IGB-42]
MLLLLCSTLWASACPGADLRAYSEEFAPFNFTEQGQFRGLAVEVLQQVSKAAGLQVDTAVLPWPRAVLRNGEDADSLLFTTVRTPQREKQYRWVGPIDDCAVVVMKRKDNTRVQITSRADIGQYSIGLPTHGADLDIFQAQHLSLDKAILVPGSGSLIRMFYAGRFDLLSGIQLSYAYQARQYGLPPSRLQVAYVLDPGQGCYFAFNPKVNPQLLQRFEAAFHALARSGQLQVLRDRYLQQGPENTR